MLLIVAVIVVVVLRKFTWVDNGGGGGGGDMSHTLHPYAQVSLCSSLTSQPPGSVYVQSLARSLHGKFQSAYRPV